MQSCLGIYIENNIIKYAKLQKDKESVKVEAYNIAFYDNDNDLEETLNRIVSETYSYKVPISINLSNEIYSSFEVSSLLSKQDIKKAIGIEYEIMCNERGYNKNSLEHRYLLVEPKGNVEKYKTISVLASKNEISKKVALFANNKISTITPISTSITNLVDIDGRENVVVVNIENKTKITSIIDGQIYHIDLLDDGMGKILEDINKIENSLSKSYEVCKNINVYTQNSSEIYSESNEYTEIVTSVLYKIAMQTKNIIGNFFSGVDKVYITGLGTCINNIDLYFQEYIPTAQCEILKPYFLKNASGQVPIKEYIEVNSAIALALDGAGMVNRNLEFYKGSPAGKSFMKKPITKESIKEDIIDFGKTIKKDFSAPLQSAEKLLIRGIAASIITIGLFTGFSGIIEKQIEKQASEISIATANAKKELDKIDSDIKTISSRTTTYKTLTDEIKNPNSQATDESITHQRVIEKDSIPNLLNRIMFVIPKKVKLTSIQNTKADHIIIKAEAEKYEQLGYFKAVLSTNGKLKKVKSTRGVKKGEIVEVKKERDLP